MKFVAKSFMPIFLAAWILLGSLGISWTETTCIYTGAKKIALSKAESCCNKSSKAHISRAKCCLLDKYQVKFSFDLTKGNKGFNFVYIPHIAAAQFLDFYVIHQDSDILSNQSNAPPLIQQIRLAKLQTYLI
jgi:hypothetical protein